MKSPPRFCAPNLPSGKKILFGAHRLYLEEDVLQIQIHLQKSFFRYARNFILTVVSIAGSTALVFAGLGLYDSSIALEKTEGAGSTSSMTSISAVLIVCAALLSILVIYNLTNINIEERKREIATLKVLGYKSGEVCGYIFREITVLSVIGTALGIPSWGTVFRCLYSITSISAPLRICIGILGWAPPFCRCSFPSWSWLFMPQNNKNRHERFAENGRLILLFKKPRLNAAFFVQ